MNQLPQKEVSDTHRVLTPRRSKPCRLLKIGTFCWPFQALGILRAHIQIINIRWFKEDWWKGNISVDFSLFVLIQTSWTNLNLMIFTKLNKNPLNLQIFLNLQNPPISIFHSKGKVGRLSKRKRVFCFIISLSCNCSGGWPCWPLPNLRNCAGVSWSMLVARPSPCTSTPGLSSSPLLWEYFKESRHGYW